MEFKKRIYCIEGVHDWGEGEVEPTVAPMLELLRRLGYWDYMHRTCATAEELKFRLETEWNGWCEKGSVLYFFTHGSPDQVWLSDEQVVGLLTLKEWIGRDGDDGCHVHFGGCDTFTDGEGNLKDLLDYTQAASVSGYATESNWLGHIAPALTCELLLFGMLWDEVKLARNTREREENLKKIRKLIQKRFGDCKFNMLVRPYGKR